jgi:single-stranded-DNA-specific exonuclease
LANWHFVTPDSSLVDELAAAAGVDRLCAAVLANRGVSPGTVEGFLNPTLKNVSPPEEEPWRVAARRIARAVENGERIGIFGDYDADGITSAAVLKLALSRYTDNLVVRLPNRQTGYGLLEPYVRDMFAEGTRLLITADCGISNHREVELATETLGIEVIVTDHHLPPEQRPDSAVAVLNPKLWDEEDPLAGVGVAWKLAWAVARELEDPDGPRHLGRLLDLVALGTVVDIAPLVGDNRTLAWTGLRYMNGGKVRVGLDTLIRAAGVRLPLTEEDLGWRLGPRINAIGRIQKPYPALDLLLTADRRRAAEISHLLNRLNSERQQRTRQAVEWCLEFADPEQDFKVVFTEEIGGMAGLIAGKVAQATGRPAAVLHRRADGSYGGSARSGETDVDLYGALHEAREFLGEWGGHRKAAGISVLPGSIEAFTERVNSAVREQHRANPELFTPAIEVEAELSLEQLTNGLLEWHERLAPFGSGNYRPVFVSEGFRVGGSRQLWEGMNLLRLGGGVSAKLAGEEVPESPFDAAYTVSRNAYSGGVELEILDWRRP